MKSNQRKALQKVRRQANVKGKANKLVRRAWGAHVRETALVHAERNKAREEQLGRLVSSKTGQEVNLRVGPHAAASEAWARAKGAHFQRQWEARNALGVPNKVFGPRIPAPSRQQLRLWALKKAKK
ncbi:MAG: hypothetical protein NTY48_05705 [Candidatus Diapherotrites archaeon]|nr:hypothetical protein [Candidatus Diapherotrites archaeon]